MTPIVWHVAPDDDDVPDPEQQKIDAAKAACAADGGHRWVATIDPGEFGPTVDLTCTRCPAGVDDLIVDGIDMVEGQVRGVTVRSGQHFHPTAVVAPVALTVHVEHHPSTPDRFGDCDVWIEVADRDPDPDHQPCERCRTTPCTVCNGTACGWCPDCHPEVPEWTT